MQDLITVAGLYLIFTTADIWGTYMKRKEERLIYFLSSQMGTVFYTTVVFVFMLVIKELSGQ
jgi:hypothetical protein